MSVVDHYAVLDLTPGTSIVQVKARFRHLAMAVHPDRNADDPECQERLKRINAAYEFLSDAAQKRQYDACCAAHAAPPYVPALSSVPVAPRTFRPPHFLTFLMLCLFLAGVAAAVVVLVGSAQSADSPVSAPAVMIIELPSNADRSVPTPDQASNQDGTEDGAVSAPSVPMSTVPVPPVGEQALWPGVSTDPPVAPVASGNVPPTPGAAPVPTGE